MIQDFRHKDVTFERKFIFDKKVKYDLFLEHRTMLQSKVAINYQKVKTVKNKW